MPCVDPEKRRAWKRADYAKNRDKYCAQRRAIYAADPERAKEISRRSRAKHIEKRRKEDSDNGKRYYAENRDAVLARTLAYEKARYKSDWAYAEARRIRCRTREAFRRAGVCKPDSTLRLLGCTAGHLRDHIESRFVSGMSWANRHLWHVDHIYPLCAASLSDPDAAAAVCNWRNLRPAWKVENIRKGGTVSEDAIALLDSIKQQLRTAVSFPSKTESPHYDSKV